jgi:hypothetical protein
MNKDTLLIVLIFVTVVFGGIGYHFYNKNQELEKARIEAIRIENDRKNQEAVRYNDELVKERRKTEMMREKAIQGLIQDLSKDLPK